MILPELKILAKQLGVKRIYKMNKKQLQIAVDLARTILGLQLMGDIRLESLNRNFRVKQFARELKKTAIQQNSAASKIARWFKAQSEALFDDGNCRLVKTSGGQFRLRIRDAEKVTDSLSRGCLPFSRRLFDGVYDMDIFMDKKWTKVENHDDWGSADRKRCFKRFFHMWEKIVTSRHYDLTNLTFVWTPIEEDEVDDLPVREGALNCAKTLLINQFPSKKDALLAIVDNDDKSWMRSQFDFAGRIIKRNIRLVNVLGHLVWEQTRYNTKTGGKNPKPQEPVTICCSNVHERDSVPQAPIVDKLELYVDQPDIFDLGVGMIWPRGEGYLLETGVLLKPESSQLQLIARAKQIGYEGDLTQVQSVFGVEYAHWKETNTIHSTARFHTIWHASQAYPVPYSKATDQEVYGIDGNSWYESFCQPESLAFPWYSQYGMPVSGDEIAVSSPPVSILSSNGTSEVVFTSWHPFVELQFRSRTRNWVPHPLLQFLLSSGMATFDILASVVVSSSHTVSFPVTSRKEAPAVATDFDDFNADAFFASDTSSSLYEHGWGRIAIGRMVAANGVDYVMTNSEDEKDHLLQSLRELGLRGPCETIVGPDSKELYKVGISSGSELSLRASYHTHSYVLAYAMIGMLAVIKDRDWSSIVMVKTDAVYSTLPWDSSLMGSTPGMFKIENKYVAVSYPEFPSLGDSPTLPPAPAATALLDSKWNLWEGPAGHGKSYQALLSTAGYKVLYLVPTRNLKRHLESINTNPQCTFMTHHKALSHTGKFVPSEIQVNVSSYDFIVWDEIGCCSSEYLEPIFTYLSDTRLLCLGDRCQLPPQIGTSPFGAILDSRFAYSFLSVDWRSKSMSLVRLKKELRGLRNSECTDVLSQTIGTTEYQTFLSNWHPSDYVLCSTHALRRRVTDDLITVHHAKYPDLPKRIRYDSKSKERSGDLEYISVSAPLPANSELAYTSTFHVCQGMTISTGKIWIMDDRISDWCSGAVYVGVTRVELISQLGLVAGPTDGLPIVSPV